MIGVQREVTGYERVEGFTDPGPTWYAILVCGHKAKLDVNPEHFIPTNHPRGRHMDCPTCTADRDRSQATSAPSTPKETL